MILLISSTLKLLCSWESVFEIAQLEGRKIQEEPQMSIQDTKTEFGLKAQKETELSGFFSES